MKSVPSWLETRSHIHELRRLSSNCYHLAVSRNLMRTQVNINTRLDIARNLFPPGNERQKKREFLGILLVATLSWMILNVPVLAQDCDELSIYDKKDGVLKEEPERSADGEPLSPGTRVCPLETHGRFIRWVRVRTETGRTGWVRDGDLYSLEDYVDRIRNRYQVALATVQALQEDITHLQSEITKYDSTFSPSLIVSIATPTPENVLEPTFTPTAARTLRSAVGVRIVTPTATRTPRPATPTQTASPRHTSTATLTPTSTATDTPIPPLAEVTGTTVNLRSGPGTEFTVIGQVRRGFELKVIARNAAGDWVQIETSQGFAWIYVALTNVSQTQLQSLSIVQYVAPEPEEALQESQAAVDQVRGRLESLRVATHSALTTYDRDDWTHWSDVDNDCQNTRAEVLIEESAISVQFRDQRNCVVDSGRWVGPWSGETFARASDLDIDHHVPLYNAHVSGGANWTKAQKSAYANDLELPGALQATKNSLNRQKGARGPEAWKPPLPMSWCQYAGDWVAVKFKYQLSITIAEKTALQEMINTCSGNDISIQPATDAITTPAPVPATPTLVLPTATFTPIPPKPATPTLVPPTPLPEFSQSGYQCTVAPYDPPPRRNSNACRACTSFASRAEFDAWHEGSFCLSHDRDKDCIPCENLS